MKGISAIIIVVMLLLISIALISVVYIWGSGLLTTTTGSATSSTTKTITTMQKIINVVAAKCSNTTPSNNIINFTVQNVGVENIEAGDMQAFVDDMLESTSPEDISKATLAKTEVKSFGIEMSNYATTRTLKVVSPSFSTEKALDCE